MLAESVYKGIDNGNFREFLHGAGGDFRLSKQEFPVALLEGCVSRPHADSATAMMAAVSLGQLNDGSKMRKPGNNSDVLASTVYLYSGSSVPQGGRRNTCVSRTARHLQHMAPAGRRQSRETSSSISRMTVITTSA